MNAQSVIQGSTSEVVDIANLLSLPVDYTVQPLDTVNVKPKSKQKSPQAKKARLSLEDKDQKAKERILRNRAAAQESRDKKRRYIAELEESNKRLVEENKRLSKRTKTLESQNEFLQTQLAALKAQLDQGNGVYSLLAADGFCDSARIVKRTPASSESNGHIQCVVVVVSQ